MHLYKIVGVVFHVWCFVFHFNEVYNIFKSITMLFRWASEIKKTSAKKNPLTSF